ncbi:MAG: FAD-dependent oxidoreductase [Candidatus Taylorbacteria bacterium]
MISKSQKTDRLAKGVVLIGTSRFGINHLRILKTLEKEGMVTIVGVVVRNKKKSLQIRSQFDVLTYGDLEEIPWAEVDIIDIVTPPETHFDLIKKCIDKVDVIVEKPLCMTSKEAHLLESLSIKNNHKIFVGHIFRYHPVSIKLKALFKDKEMPHKIVGTFVNTIDTDRGREPSLELLHFFDVVDFVWGRTPIVVSSRSESRVSIVDHRYSVGHDARYILGWKGIEKIRSLVCKFEGFILKADYVKNIIEVIKGESMKTYDCRIEIEPLYLELKDFILNGRTNIDVATRIIVIAEMSIPRTVKKLSVAILGGGIFGTCIAAELGKFCEVDLFEKNSDLMQEGSFVNQFRHHKGYHYPRSDETVLDIQQSSNDFEKVFKKAIIDTSKTYYGLAKHGSMVNAKQFLAFCRRHRLPYKKAFPPKEMLSREVMDLSIEVPEPNYHHAIMKTLVKSRLANVPAVKVLYDTLVTGCRLDSSGKKDISFKRRGHEKKKSFDIVINATYANLNRFADWVGFDKYPIRVDLAEVLIVRLPIEPLSITVIDGPFATLMPTGNPNEFTLYHVKESIIDRYVPTDGLVKKIGPGKTRQQIIFDESLKLFPILKRAEIVESRIVHRGVQAYHEHDDSRVADIIEHGFGCWSILSGKILSSVTTAKKLAKTIKQMAEKS